jgi:hypothetical protein
MLLLQNVGKAVCSVAVCMLSQACVISQSFVLTVAYSPCDAEFCQMCCQALNRRIFFSYIRESRVRQWLITYFLNFSISSE